MNKFFFAGIILAAGSGNRLQKYIKPKGTINIKKNLTIIDNIINNGLFN